MEIPQEVIQQFSSEFMSGMAGEESRSRRLGDVGANAPSRWQWGSAEKIPHVLLLLYAEPGNWRAGNRRCREIPGMMRSPCSTVSKRSA